MLVLTSSPIIEVSGTLNKKYSLLSGTDKKSESKSSLDGKSTETEIKEFQTWANTKNAKLDVTGKFDSPTKKVYDSNVSRYEDYLFDKTYGTPVKAPKLPTKPLSTSNSDKEIIKPFIPQSTMKPNTVQMKNFPFSYSLSSVGFALGIAYAVNNKTGFWKGVGYSIIFSIAGGSLGAGIDYLRKPKL